MPSIEAVLFDFSGVLTTSPWPALAASGGGNLELVVGPYHEDTDHPWHKLERGEITLETWLTEVQALAASTGATFDLAPLQRLFGELSVHDDVVAYIEDLRLSGYRTALITNNVAEGSGAWRSLVAVDDLFDVVVDSSSVGMRKPNPAIFTHTLDLLDVRRGPRGVPGRRGGQPGRREARRPPHDPGRRPPGHRPHRTGRPARPPPAVVTPRAPTTPPALAAPPAPTPPPAPPASTTAPALAAPRVPTARMAPMAPAPPPGAPPSPPTHRPPAGAQAPARGTR